MSRLRFGSMKATLLLVALLTGTKVHAGPGVSCSSLTATADTNGTWVLLSNLHAPPALARPVGVFDPVRARLLVIEGAYGTGWPEVQSLELQPSPRWCEMQVEGPPPVGRTGPSVVYDPVRDRLLLFAGVGYADVWSLDLASTPSWHLMVTSGEGPGPRAWHSAIYDPVRDRMIVFGGIDGSAYLADAWALSLLTNQWERLALPGAGPSARAYHRAVYDSLGDRMLVFGGEDQAGYQNDVWALPLQAGSGWTALALAGSRPSPRARFGMAFDARRARLLVEGGFTGTGYAGDLWALDLADSVCWEAVATEDSLEPRADLVMVSDGMADRVIVYGGNSGSATWDQTATLSLGGPLHWDRFLPSSPPALPGPRTGQSTVYDSRRGRILVLGGSYRPTDVPGWSLTAADDPVWAALPKPMPIPSGPAVYDSISDRVIVFLGAETWYLSLADDSWHLLDSSGHPYLRGATYTFDPVRHRVLVCGGIDGMDLCRCTLHDVYELSLEGTPAWNRIGACPHAQGMAGHSAFYDPVGDRLVVMGGYWQNGTPMHHDFGPEWWTTRLDGDSLVWSPLYASNAEPASGQSVYDPLRRRVLRFSDYGTLGVWQVWSRSVADSVPWLPLAKVGAGPLAETPIVFDSAHDRAVMTFTVPAGTVSSPPDEVWALFFGAIEIKCARKIAAWDGVEVDWCAPLARGLSAMLQRCDARTRSWSDLGELQFDEAGVLHARDVTVQPSTRYGYRLAMSDGITSTFSDEVWLDVPAGPTFTFAGAQPNPTCSGLRVVFSLPDASPARLDVMDVSGRRMLSRDVGSLGPGLHTMDLAQQQVFRPGLYLMRLTRGNETRTARAVVIR
jgi:hypothetical protein